MPSSNFKCGGNVRPSRFVKISADHTVIEADANEDAVGISHESGREPPLPSVSTIYAGQDGDFMPVYGDGDECLLTAGDTITAGLYLKSDADGQGVPVATTGTTNQLARAQALEGGSSGELIRVRVVRQTIRPALT